MNIASKIFTELTTNSTLKSLFGLVKDMVPAGIMDWYFMGKMARRNADGTRKPHEYDDEKEYRRVAAKLRDRLRTEGKGEETLVDEVDVLMADLPAHEAFTFRECLVLTTDEGEKLLIFEEVARAPVAIRAAKIKAVAQQPAVIRWVTAKFVDAHRRYMDTLRLPLPAAVSDELFAFANTLTVTERIQFMLSVGSYEDDAARLAAITEIVNLPPAERLDRARARGYIGRSPVRAGKEKAVRLYRLLEEFYGQLDNPAGNARADAMCARQVAALAAEWNNLLIGRAIRGLGRLIS